MMGGRRGWARSVAEMFKVELGRELGRGREREGGRGDGFWELRS